MRDKHLGQKGLGQNWCKNSSEIIGNQFRPFSSLTWTFSPLKSSVTTPRPLPANQSPCRIFHESSHQSSTYVFPKYRLGWTWWGYPFIENSWKTASTMGTLLRTQVPVPMIPWVRILQVPVTMTNKQLHHVFNSPDQRNAWKAERLLLLDRCVQSLMEPKPPSIIVVLNTPVFQTF